ncbi:MAG: M48 family metalloprotease [Acidobacteriota bacterium]|nr:M48 family metalloprotease [Acidobacteriota bacterium]
MKKSRLMVAALSVAIPLLAADTKPTDKKKDPEQIGERNIAGRFNNFYSIDKEIALGKQLSVEVRRQARIVDDPIVAEYINHLGQALARNSDVTFPVSFTMIESDEINAFTLPGGFVFLHTGMFRLSDNEAELASVLAHELGHAAARHATRQATQRELMAAATIPLVLFGGGVGLFARPAAAVVGPLAFFHFSREFETEADLLGIQYLWKSGYDPNASVDMFERVESTERRQPGSVSRLFRTHPLTADRIEKTQKNIDTLLPAHENYILNTSEYEEVRARLNDLLLQHKPAAQDRAAPTLRRAQ